MDAAKTMSPLIMSGLFDRFPNLKVFFAETRAGWIPFWLEMADYWYDKHLNWNQRLLGFRAPKRLPSEYVHDNIVLSVQHVERTAVAFRHLLGVDNIMFATDFPHIECDWPDTREYADKMFANVPWSEAYAILAGNMIEFFHLEETVMGKQVAQMGLAPAW